MVEVLSAWREQIEKTELVCVAPVLLVSGTLAFPVVSRERFVEATSAVRLIQSC
jgi:hypothetical protein